MGGTQIKTFPTKNLSQQQPHRVKCHPHYKMSSRMDWFNSLLTVKIAHFTSGQLFYWQKDKPNPVKGQSNKLISGSVVPFQTYWADVSTYMIPSRHPPRSSGNTQLVGNKLRNQLLPNGYMSRQTLIAYVAQQLLPGCKSIFLKRSTEHFICPVK